MVSPELDYNPCPGRLTYRSAIIPSDPRKPDSFTPRIFSKFLFNQPTWTAITLVDVGVADGQFHSRHTYHRLHDLYCEWTDDSCIWKLYLPYSQLARAKNNTILPRTETLLTKLMHRIIQTGAASAVCAAVDLAMFVGFPSANYHVVP